MSKPLGGKSYGSIAHLPMSRMGPADHHCHEGQARICTIKVRDRQDTIIVQEKLDGSNVGVAKVNSQILALTRAGYLANTSPYLQHHLFHDWVAEPLQQARFQSLLNEGERACGEWLLQAHGTRYDLETEPFVVFDLIQGKRRATWAEMKTRLTKESVCLQMPATVHVANESCSVTRALNLLGDFGRHGASEQIEGAVWRVERHGEVDFLAKYVRPGKQDGAYLPEKTGCKVVWNECRDISKAIQERMVA